MGRFVYLTKRLLEESLPSEKYLEMFQTLHGAARQAPRTTTFGLATIVAISMLLLTSASAARSEGTETRNLFRESQYVATSETPLAYEELPEIVESQTNYDFAEYLAKEPKTVSSVAKKFGVSTDTIRWANNINGDKIKAGEKLKIPPVDGLEYKVKTGDSVESVAGYFATETEAIIAFNRLNSNDLKPGRIIYVPDGVKPPPPQITNDPSGSDTVAISRVRTPVASGNSYTWGNCTWYVFNRRAELGRPIPTKLGDARSWASRASSKGFVVDRNPSVGAVMAEAGTNHVALVESLNPDGSITISEMNYNWRLGVKTTRTIPAGSVGRHLYIH